MVCTRRDVDGVACDSRVDCFGDGEVVPGHLERRAASVNRDDTGHAHAAVRLAEVGNVDRCIVGDDPLKSRAACVEWPVKEEAVGHAVRA